MRRNDRLGYCRWNQIRQGGRGQISPRAARSGSPDRVIDEHGDVAGGVEVGGGQIREAVAVEVAHGQAGRVTVHGEGERGLESAVAIAQEHIHGIGGRAHGGNVQDTIAIEVRHYRGAETYLWGWRSDGRPERTVAVAQHDADTGVIAECRIDGEQVGDAVPVEVPDGNAAGSRDGTDDSGRSEEPAAGAGEDGDCAAGEVLAGFRVKKRFTAGDGDVGDAVAVEVPHGDRVGNESRGVKGIRVAEGPIAIAQRHTQDRLGTEAIYRDNVQVTIAVDIRELEVGELAESGTEAGGDGGLEGAIAITQQHARGGAGHDDVQFAVAV